MPLNYSEVQELLKEEIDSSESVTLNNVEFYVDKNLNILGSTKKVHDRLIKEKVLFHVGYAEIEATVYNSSDFDIDYFSVYVTHSVTGKELKPTHDQVKRYEQSLEETKNNDIINKSY